MTVLLNDFKRQWDETGEDVHAAVERVGRSGWYVLGSEVTAFEEQFARFMNVPHCVGCASGLDAIELALRALELRPGERVLTTPLSAFATTLAIVRAGGIPLFVDVDKAGNLDLALVEDCLVRRPDVRFVVPVHLFGNLLDVDRLAHIRARFKVRVVEDCAQAIGVTADRQPGSVGDLAATSFYPTKNLGALGDGGAVYGNDADLMATCRTLRDYGQSQKYVHERLGMNSRLDEMHAAILRSAMMPRLHAWGARRLDIAQRYRAGLRNSWVSLLPISTSSWHLFPVRVEARLRTQFRDHLGGAGVQSGVHYPRIISEQPALSEMPFEIDGPLDQARQLASEEVSLPMHPHLHDEDVERVIHAVNTWSPA